METIIEKTYFYDTGGIATEYSFLKGTSTRHGRQTSYHRSGNKYHVCIESHGMLNGMRQDWFYDGERESILQFRKDNLHGFSIEFSYAN